MTDLGLSIKNITLAKKKFINLIEELADNKFIEITELNTSNPNDIFYKTKFPSKSKKKKKIKKVKKDQINFNFNEVDLCPNDNNSKEDNFYYECKDFSDECKRTVVQEN